MGRKSFVRLLLAASLFLTKSVLAQNTSPYWRLSGNAAVTTPSKLGTTNSTPLNLVTNNTTRIRVASNGKIGIGTTTPRQRLHVESANNQVISVNTSPLGALSGSGVIGYAKALPTAYGQRLGYFLVGSRGEAQNNYNAAGISGYSEGAWTAASRPTYLTFETTPIDGTTRAERMRISAEGNIGIGTVSPSAPLDVASTTASTVIYAASTFSGEDDRIAVYGTSVNGLGYGYGLQGVGGYIGAYGLAQAGNFEGSAYGLFGSAVAEAEVGVRYGVYGQASGGSEAYGVYGLGISGSSFNAAGYFEGDVYAANYLSTSDRRFKTDIAPLEKALSQIMKLKPSTYQFKGEEYKGIGLPDGEQLGLIADEVKEVFPQLVKKAVHPARYDEKDRTKVVSPKQEYEAVNYQGLIPVLVAAIKEQETRHQKELEIIEKQQQQIDELKAMVNKLVHGSGAVSLTNASMGLVKPNPVKGSASIRYSVPEGSNGQLLVSDAAGRQVKSISLKNSGTLNLDASTLASGVYNYSLIVNGKMVQTEKMTVVR